MQAPPIFLGLTRWEWDGGGIRFRIWTRPVIGNGGRQVVPVTLVWNHPDGRHGIAHCDGFMHAMDAASQVMGDGTAAPKPCA